MTALRSSAERRVLMKHSRPQVEKSIDAIMSTLDEFEYHAP